MLMYDQHCINNILNGLCIFGILRRGWEIHHLQWVLDRQLDTVQSDLTNLHLCYSTSVTWGRKLTGQSDVANVHLCLLMRNSDSGHSAVLDNQRGGLALMDLVERKRKKNTGHSLRFSFQKTPQNKIYLHNRAAFQCFIID